MGNPVLSAMSVDKTMRAIGLFLASVVLAVESLALAETPVQFEDPNMNEVVESYLQFSDPLPSDMLTLKYLVFFTDITGLGGLEYAKNLEELNFNRLRIEDLSVLAELTNLKFLSFHSCEVEDIPSLANLTCLETLLLSDCGVTDISALANLTNLTRLDLSGNPISDISALSGLTNLRRLGLCYTRTTDCSLLLELPSAGIPGWGGEVPPDSPATMEVDWVSYTPESD